MVFLTWGGLQFIIVVGTVEARNKNVYHIPDLTNLMVFDLGEVAAVHDRKGDCRSQK